MAGLEPYHTSIAAGIKTTSHFPPVIKASKPRRIRATVAVIDFFALALMVVSSLGG
jgi:hypothetical protein